MQAAAEHDRCWHSRLLSMLYMGLHLGIYRTADETPYWGGSKAKGYSHPQEPQEEAAAEAQEAGATTVTKAKEVAAKAAGAAAEGQEEDKQVATGNLTVE
eukprot:1393974-Lingulodinium_polyedra.AAC.1